MKLSDHDILFALKSGGPSVHRTMDYVYLKSRKKIIGYVMKNGGNKEDGQDVLQDAVSAFYTNIINNRYRGESDVEGYLYGIARNLWLKTLKTKGKMQVLKDASHLKETPPDHKLDEDTFRDLDNVLQKMDVVCRDLLVHAFYYNYSAVDLSNKFDFKNEQVARNKKYKCLKKLRKLMENIKYI